MRLAGWVDAGREEVLLNHYSGVNISECSNLLLVLIGGNFDHFPSKEDLDVSLLALLKCDFIGITKLEDLLVGSPVLDASILGSATLKNVLAEEVLVVESIEVRALSLVWEFGRIANHVSVGVVPSVVVVAINSFLVVNGVNKHVALRSMLQFMEALNVLTSVVETSCHN